MSHPNYPCCRYFWRNALPLIPIPHPDKNPDHIIIGGTIDDPSLTISNVTVAVTDNNELTAKKVNGSYLVLICSSVNLCKWDGTLFYETLVSLNYFTRIIGGCIREKKKNKLIFSLHFTLLSRFFL